MKNTLKDYVYQKLFILIEDNDKKLYKSIYDDSEFENVDDYLYTVVTSVSQKKVAEEVWHLIQHEDKEIGWIKLEKSIQVFRFQPLQFKVIEENFQSNELNEFMGISKDFISHFKNKLLTVKSEVHYENEKYYSVFIKNKFHGFHKSQFLDPLVEVNLPISNNNLLNSNLYTRSDFTNIVTEIPEFEKGTLIAFFEKLRIGSLKLNTNTYWIDVDTLNDITIPIIERQEKSLEQLLYDDLLFSVEQQNQKSVDMLKTIINAKDYINDTEVSKYLAITGKKKPSDNVKEIKNELRSTKSENLELKRQLRKSKNELKLANSRLDHQYDYKDRLEEQRDKYKSRMQLVEEKLKDLDEKYKNLKAKKSERKKFFN